MDDNEISRLAAEVIRQQNEKAAVDAEVARVQAEEAARVAAEREERERPAREEAARVAAARASMAAAVIGASAGERFIDGEGIEHRVADRDAKKRIHTVGIGKDGSTIIGVWGSDRDNTALADWRKKV